jgi:DNA-binding NtrC family response regulator
MTPPVLEADTVKRLQDCPWPGNVREIRNLIHRVVVMGERVPLAGRATGSAAPAASPSSEPSRIVVGMSLDETERILILDTLSHTGGNRRRATDILQVTPRTLRGKLRSYRLQGLMA